MRRLAFALACLGVATAAAAQPSRGARVFRPVAEGRVEVSGGLRLSGPSDLGDVAAKETASGGRTSTVFDSASTLDGAVGVEGRLGVRVTRALQVEGAVSLLPATISTRLSKDVDGAANTTAETALTQWLVEGGVRARLGRWRARHLAPFVTAGAGYLRHVYDGRTLIESGQSYYLGAGADYVVRAAGRGAVKGAGIRADIRASLLQNGALLDDSLHLSPVAGVGFFVMF